MAGNVSNEIAATASRKMELPVFLSQFNACLPSFQLSSAVTSHSGNHGSIAMNARKGYLIFHGIGQAECLVDGFLCFLKLTGLLMNGSESVPSSEPGWQSIGGGS